LHPLVILLTLQTTHKRRLHKCYTYLKLSHVMGFESLWLNGWISNKLSFIINKHALIKVESWISSYFRIHLFDVDMTLFLKLIPMMMIFHWNWFKSDKYRCIMFWPIIFKPRKNCFCTFQHEMCCSNTFQVEICKKGESMRPLWMNRYQIG
jgi:hypothetical protein